MVRGYSFYGFSFVYVIFQDGTTADPTLQRDAWGAAFVLMVGVLILSIVGRLFAARLTRKSR